MNKTIKNLAMALVMGFGANAMADVEWKGYSSETHAMAEKAGKVVLLGFHKKGCGTCAAQDEVLENAGVNELKNIERLRVERKDESMNEVYEKYGFNKRQWSAMVLLKDGKEIARLEPGTTDERKIKEFLLKAN